MARENPPAGMPRNSPCWALGMHPAAAMVLRLWQGGCQHAAPQGLDHTTVNLHRPRLALWLALAGGSQRLFHDGMGHVQLAIVLAVVHELDVGGDADMIDAPPARREVMGRGQAQPRAVLQRKNRLHRSFAVALGADEGR